MANSQAPFNYRIADYAIGKVSVPYSNYLYTPCDPEKEIRLLEVLPSAQFEDGIRCRLREFSVDNPPYYSALSYEWGDPTDCCTIHIDDIAFPATRNLCSALAQLRAKSCPKLWVDAICINQADVHERNAHLAKMRDIYNRADTVSIWLGPEEQGSEIVMDILRAIHLSRRERPNHTEKAWTPDKRLLAKHHQALQAFIGRSYFHRVWVIQEVAWASQVTVFCGRQLVSWRALPILMDLLEQGNSPHYVWADLKGLQHRHFKRLCDVRSNRVQGKPTGILQLLSESAESKATDARDKFYALLGLASDRQLYIDQPHYEWTIEKICMETTKSVIQMRQSLDIILTAQRSVDTTSILPSWCPNYMAWSPDATTASISSYVSGQHQRHRLGKLCTRWNTTSDSFATRSNTVFVSNGDLQVRGIPIAEIETLVGSFDGGAQTNNLVKVDSFVLADEKQILERITQAFLLYRRDKDRDEQGKVWDYNIAFFLFKFPSAEGSVLACSNRRRTPDLHALDEWRKANGRFMIQGKTLKERAGKADWASAAGQYRMKNGLFTAVKYGSFLNGGSSSMSVLEETTRRVHIDVEDALLDLQSIAQEDLRFMQTTEQRFGWAHPHALPGDSIFLIAGCSIPVVLRAVGDGGGNDLRRKYRVVGHAYVPGAMNSEIWGTIPSGDLHDIILS